MEWVINSSDNKRDYEINENNETNEIFRLFRFFRFFRNPSFFHLLTERDWNYTHLGNRGGLHEQTNRSGPGDPGPAYPEDSSAGAAPWLGDRAAAEASLGRRPVCQRRLSLSCSPQAGAGGLDQGRMEAERE